MESGFRLPANRFNDHGIDEWDILVGSGGDSSVGCQGVQVTGSYFDHLDLVNDLHALGDFSGQVAEVTSCDEGPHRG